MLKRAPTSTSMRSPLQGERTRLRPITWSEIPHWLLMLAVVYVAASDLSPLGRASDRVGAVERATPATVPAGSTHFLLGRETESAEPPRQERSAPPDQDDFGLAPAPDVAAGKVRLFERIGIAHLSHGPPIRKRST